MRKIRVLDNVYDLITINMEDRFKDNVAFRFYDTANDAVTTILYKDYVQDIRKAVNYFQSTIPEINHFGYLSDERFAQMYVQFKGQKKSRKQIELFLQKKGISRELIDQACEEYYGQNEDSELEQILVQMRRKAAGKLPLSYEEKMKLMGSFYRKGFQSDSIKKALDIVVSECEHD